MKQRILSALGGLVVLAVVLSLFDTLVLNGAISIIALLAVYEFFHATKISENRLLSGVAYLVTVIIPFIPRANESDWLPVVLLPYIGVLFCILLATHKTTRVEQAAMTFMISLAIPLSLSSAVYFRDSYGTVIGLFYLIFALGGAWFSDTGAYFVGCSIGKHKMTPVISPHKTWEGAVGGVVICTICMLLVGKLFEFAVPGFTIDYLRLALLAPVASVTSIVGDLSASLVKRQYGVKDFGNIMPGHGGVLDRFDSVLFVAPLIWGIVQNFPIAQIR
ncbi:MAG: phosphatidate cytidylyltransferase [Negativibacillus sp.]